MVECFRPFLRHPTTLDLSRPTLRRHRDNLWVLGGEIIRQLQMDSDLRKQPIEQVVGDLIDDEGGPLISHGEPEAEQRAFDATCRKFSRFLAARREPPRPRAKPSTYDEPSEHRLTAPMQTARPRGSRSSPTQPRSGAPQGAGL